MSAGQKRDDKEDIDDQHPAKMLRPTGQNLSFVTGNEHKLRETRAILGDNFPLTLVGVNIDLPEYQGTPQEIVRRKCSLAAEQVNGPVIVEDVSLCFKALNGMPGPYIKWFLDAIGREGLWNLLAAYPDKSATALCTYGYCPGPGLPTQFFEGRVEGQIVPPRGASNFGWDPVFLPDGFTQTFAEMDAETKNGISHRRRAVELLREFFMASQ
eukprot:gnl/Spiro4/7340_TR3843_c0_g4_i1.p1 gnl/Spiro4/7340_TR3843_c0_g4~~gnl/Spiro4/7340_TR3843_c0_g4_i1.p1  ORF type:complete len:222 (+),score=56.66 gnl/Spiro4/7340_TR3843_c0_g4_i1:32-667(+)